MCDRLERLENYRILFMCDAQFTKRQANSLNKALVQSFDFNDIFNAISNDTFIDIYNDMFYDILNDIFNDIFDIKSTNIQ